MILRLFDAIEARVARVRRRGDNFFVHYPGRDDTAPYPDDAAFSLVGFWNENVERLAQMRPLNPPALFVEFLPHSWQETGNHVKRADIEIRLHLVYATLARQNSDFRAEWNRRFLLARALLQCLVGFGQNPDARGLSFSCFLHSGSAPDHNHGQISEDIYSFRTHAVDASALFENNMRLTPLPVTLDTGEVFSPEFGAEMV